MRIFKAATLLALAHVAIAGPRKNLNLGRRQASASDCSCPANVVVTTTSLSRVVLTSSATVSTDAGGTEVTVNTKTDTTTIQRTTTVEASQIATTTTTIGGFTITTTGSPTTITRTSTISDTTITTCVVSAYKMKRQDTASANSAPSSIVVTTNFGVSSAAPNRCVCRLVSKFPSATSSTSPATTSRSSSANTCSCSSAQTLATTVTSTVTDTFITTSTISDYSTSTVTPETLFTTYSDTTVETTSTTTITVSQARVTITNRSTGTTTSTKTPTYVSCATPEATCNNSGVRWAIYPNTNAAGANNTNKDSTYSTFNPTVIKNRQPLYQNVTYTLGGFRYPAVQPVIISFYNSTRKFESDYIIINHVGYIFAQVTGVYTFSVSQSDDITLFWIGANAYSGYTRANANIVNPYGAGTSTYKVNMVAGNYYPYRIIFGNAQQAIVFQASLTAPDGTVILNSNSRRSPYLVQFTCDNTTAPPFPEFGSET